jgi:hypothetical protein
MPAAEISRDQLKRLQTLWSQYARREMWEDSSRARRIAWASSVTKRELSSFNDLTGSEASTLINLLQAEMGIAETSPARAKRRYRSAIKDRDQARAAGTEGRRGSSNSVTMATSEDLAMIDAQLTLMDWTRARLDAFLASSSSPLGKRSNPQLRTVADVNRVMWALKRIAKKSKSVEVQA